MNPHNRDKKTELAILSMSLLILGPQAISPAVAGMIQAFPELPTRTVRLVVSLPLLTLVLFTVPAGLLGKRIDKKKIALAGIAVYTAAGAASAFSASFAMLVVCRLLLGAGLGLFASYGVSFLSMLFEGDARRRLIGWQSTACNAGSLLLTTAAGLLAPLGWSAASYIYLLGIPVFALVLRYVPSFPPEAPRGPEPPEARAGRTRGFTGRLALVTFGNVMFFLVFFIVFSDYSVLILKSGLGNASAGSVGLSLLSVSALAVSLFYQRLSGALKRFTAPVGVAAASLGFAVIGSAQSLAAASAGAAVLGVGFGIVMPHCYAQAAQAVDGPHQPLAAAAQTFATNIASFGSSYVLNLALRAIPQEVSEKNIFTCAGIAMAVYFFVLMILSPYMTGRRSLSRPADEP